MGPYRTFAQQGSRPHSTWKAYKYAHHRFLASSFKVSTSTAADVVNTATALAGQVTTFELVVQF
jgi:hypothetical protein